MTRRGFSLIEVLASLAILVVLSTAIYTMLADLARARERLGEEIAEQDIASVLFERIETGLVAAIAGGEVAGISGSHDRLRIQTRGVTPPIGGPGAEAVIAVGDLQGLELAFDRSLGTVEGARWDVLSDRAGRLEPWGEGIERLRFRYLVGRSWQGSFDSREAGGLPAAIEVSLWLGEPAIDPDLLPPEDGFDDGGVDDPLFAGAMGAADGTMSEVDGRAGRAGPTPDELLAEIPTRVPDRRRVIVIPDGPEIEAIGDAGAGGSP